jgi:AraC-like DNA-binding protein
MTSASEAVATVGTPERWRVAGGSPSRRLDAWADVLAATHLAFDVRASVRTSADFHGAVTRHRLGDLMLVDCAATPFVGHRGQPVMDGGPEQRRHESILGFQFVGRGVELVREGGRQLAVSAGDVVLWDGLQPTNVEIVEAFYKRTLIFPRDRVLAVCPRLAEQEVFPSLDGNGPARLLVRYMNSLALELPRLDESAREITRYVRTHLQDEALGPASIAHAYAMSIRALHALFEDIDQSVAGLVRSERLARCMEDLRRPSGGSVTEIAFRWGFSDAAHFSRLFKRAFGMTPSVVRHEALADER